MADSVSGINPFTLNPWTDMEISELDDNKDGVISQSEVLNHWGWLSSRDSDGDVAIGDDFGDGLFGAARKAGMTEQAKDAKELQANMAILTDEFTEQYFTQHSELTDSERTALQSLISSESRQFVAQYILAHQSGPYDMKAVMQEFEEYMTKAIDNNNKALAAVRASVDGYKNNVDSSRDAMLSTAESAMQNNNVTDAEWATVRNKSVQYLMSMILSGNINDDFMKNLNPKYAKDSNWKMAVSYLDKVSTESDPIKIQQYLAQAQKCLVSFLNSIGKDKAVKAINDFAQAQKESAITEKLNTYADNWLETKINSRMSDDEKQRLVNFANTCVGKFLAKLAEDGRLSADIPDAELKAEFTAYLDELKAEFDTTQENLTRSASGHTNDYNNLIAISDAANSNGNVSDEEKEKIVKAATKLIINQMLSNMDDIPLLEQLNPNYKNTADYKTLQSLINQMQNSLDVEEIAKLQAQAEELLNKMLNSYSGDKLVKAIDGTKPVQVSDSTKGSVVYNSSISSDYQANVSRTTSRGSQDEGRLDEIQNMAKADLQAVAESLKAQLKAELGTAYNENEIQKYINDAINDTIALFTKNVRRANGHGNYNVSSSEQAFVFLRRSGTHKGRYVYNVKALTDTFISKFNETSKAKTAAKNDPSLATYDKENVIADSVGNDYLREKDYKDKDKVTAIEQAKTRLQSVKAALKSSLIAEGSKVPAAKIDELIDSALQTTLTDMSWLEYVYDWNDFDYTYKFNIKTLTDTFLDKFDKLYAKEMQNYK